MTIRSEQFDDIYFSPDDGLAETHHVFLHGNNLPAAWENQKSFTITETGFGTGLNFLCAWKLFDETAKPDQVLDYVSFEKYPLSPSVIRESLARWSGHFDGRLETMAMHYPLRVNGFHRVHLSPRVRLTLVFDDVNDALPQLVVPHGVNAWFLDGFAPAKNPQMWNETLFREMQRLSAPGATAASFTAAGHVRRNLAAHGFSVTKARGYGRKRDMTRAIFIGTGQSTTPSPVRRVAIIGGGLAGTSCAWALKRRGITPVIHEPSGQLASFASGNVLGLFNPRFSRYRTPESDFYSSGYAAMARLQGLAEMPRTCGSLHLVTDDEKHKRFEGVCENWGWHPDHARMLSADEAGQVAGIALSADALFLPDSGHISPAALCRAYAEGVDVVTGEPDPASFDAIILANGVMAKEHPALSWLPVHTVRGQVSHIVPARDATPVLKTNICYSGYISASNDRGMVAGSTFQQWRHDTDVTDDDHAAIIAHLESAIPALKDAYRVTGGRAGLRCAAKDRVPVIGPVPGEAGLYVSTAHGSHGLISSLAGAEYLADCLSRSVWSLAHGTAGALDSVRFRRREEKRGLPRG